MQRIALSDFAPDPAIAVLYSIIVAAMDGRRSAAFFDAVAAERASWSRLKTRDLVRDGSSPLALHTVHSIPRSAND